MKLESTLSYAQDFATGPHSELINLVCLHPYTLIHYIPIYYNLRVCLGVTGDIFSSGSPTKILYAFIISPVYVTLSEHLIPHDFITVILQDRDMVSYIQLLQLKICHS
jgi:hypothetical protein